MDTEEQSVHHNLLDGCFENTQKGNITSVCMCVRVLSFSLTQQLLFKQSHAAPNGIAMFRYIVVIPFLKF